MERHGGTIYFDQEERSVARLPASLDISQIPGAFHEVARLRMNCQATLEEVSQEEVYETEHLQQAKATAQLRARYDRLEAISQCLGGMVASVMSQWVAGQIVRECLADVPGLDLDRLHKK